MAAEKRPTKGILKTSSSFDHDGQQDAKKQAQWDEMNILATYHPEGKDYGHMKIDEPPTPYSKESGTDGEEVMEGAEDGTAGGSLDVEGLAARLQNPKPRILQEEESSEEDPDETEEERAQRKLFEQRRKVHYNEFYAVKLARQLMENDDEETEENSSEKKEETETSQ